MILHTLAPTNPMLIPRFWSRAESQATTPDGKLVRFHVWRGSRSDPAEAQALADEAVARIADRVRRGAGFPERYAYGDRPLREPVVREIGDAPDAAITRNSYGALVLNAARAFFIDVDLSGDEDGNRPASSSSSSTSFSGGADPMAMAREVVDALPIPGGIKSMRGGLFGSRSSGSAPPPPPPAPADPATAAMDRLRRWVASHPEWRVRVYRTRAGLRYLVTHDVFSPTAPETHAAMSALGADPQYMKLCQVQKSFRARLTPKPWRIGVENPPVTFPYEGPGEEQEMKAWVAEYGRAAAGRATCQLLDELGSGTEHPDIAPLRELHDELTRTGSNLPLA